MANLLGEGWIGTFGKRPRVLSRFFLRIVGVIGPGFRSVRAAVAVDFLVRFFVGMMLRGARPGWIFLVTGTVANTLETRGIADRGSRRWRRVVSLVEGQTEAVESDTFAVSEYERIDNELIIRKLIN